MRTDRPGTNTDRVLKVTTSRPIPPSPRGHVAFSALEMVHGVRAIFRNAYDALKSWRRDRNPVNTPQAGLAADTASIMPVSQKARKNLERTRL